ncbi:2-dehydro-3-deoxy-6-phosphogalactonate aldolase [Paracidovorax anthurii]|uniref:2-keto-3-deoxy-phosphogalactonate aldolase n=1 Tax=Paracidovorax anthurii TaxID=78229 RepID=A0A328Z0B7_9BURK|nr:2-dehydro-3-deoxy-6-phosphogalactonate aldolase [Paracidovorax anthurii]RAR79409.1 2-keto-3-deoxy-phosphogalactonate aldolase [Paracidovorax anthurii]
MNPIDKHLSGAMQHCGLIAILRGIQPQEAATMGHALYGAGFRTIEVPLNSPEPLASIRLLRDALPADCLVGAGTVLSAQACADVAAAGGQIIVMPHSDPEVIRAARAAGMACVPGVATLTEAFAALAAGVHMLKLFPAEALPPPVLKAWRAVITPSVALIPVGGIVPESIATYAAAGASGFGLGSALYRPGDSAASVARKAAAFVEAWHGAYVAARGAASGAPIGGAPRPSSSSPPASSASPP